MRLSQQLLQPVPAARRYLGLTVGLGALASGAVVAQAILLSRAISQVFLAGWGPAEVAPLLLALLALALLRAGLAWGAEVSAQRGASLVKRDLRARLVGHVLALGPVYASGERSGELANTLGPGVEALDEYVSQYLPQIALSALAPTIVLLAVFPRDPIAGLVLLLTAPIMPLFMILIGGMAKTLTERQWADLSRMSAHFLDVLQGLTTLKLFGRSREQAAAIGRISERFGLATMQVLRVAFLSALVLELTASLSTAIVAVAIGLRLLHGGLPFEQALAVLILAPEFYLPLRLLGARHHAGMAGVEAARRIGAILETRLPSRRDTSTPISTHQDSNTPRSERLAPEYPGDEAPPRFDIELADVHVAYDGGARPALRGLSLRIGHGQTVALVGPSGAGKSTVAQLLLRFVDPDDGAITVGGVPLESLDRAAWRAQVAWVPQRPTLLHATVAQNIGMARPAAGMDAIVAAARAAQAHEFIAALPQGYDTPIGERGARLSGGQQQRLALARAFLKDAPVLILDEPTAQLDRAHAQLVYDAVARLMRGRTALLITHDRSIAARADRIVELEDGQETRRHGDTETRRHGDTGFRFTSPKPQAPGPKPQAPGPKPQAPGSTPQAPGSTPQAPSLTPHTTWRLLRLIAPLSGWFALAALLGFATIGSSVGLMATSAYLISKAALAPSIAELQIAIVGVRFFGIARGVLRYLERYVAHTATFGLLARLRVWLYQAVEPLAPALLLRERGGDLLSRMVADVETLQQFYVRVIAPPLVALLVAGLAGALLGQFARSLAAVLLAFLALAGVALPLLIWRLSRGPGAEQVVARADLSAALVEGVQGTADLLAFGCEQRYHDEVDRIGARLARAQERAVAIRGLHGALSGLLASLGGLAVLWVAVPLVRGGQIDGVYLALLVLTALASFEAVAPLAQAAQELASSRAAAGRLFALADRAPPVREPAAPSTSRDAGLEVRDLSFAYPGEGAADLAGPRPHVLDRVSFSLPPGGRLAIVGPSGAGKSTLASLLLRFWDYEHGQITIGGHDLRSYQAEDVRGLIGVVAQQTHLFNGTIRENLLLACPAAREEQLIAAARQAQIHEYIAGLPQGYDTWIGEQGLRLSGGERQRLAIARALLKDAPILILDEPTAHLDASTARDVMRSLGALMAGRTTLLITHQLADLTDMDTILVLDGGRPVEQGRHHELLQAGGHYWRMWQQYSRE